MACAVLIAAGLVFADASPARAATIAVDTTADVVDSGDGVTSLREAFGQSTANIGDDTIVLQTSATYTMTLGCAGTTVETANASGSFDHTDTAGSLTIIGNGATVAGCAAGSLVDVVIADRGVDLTTEDLTVTGGKNGGIYRNGSASGVVSMVDSVVHQNGSLPASTIRPAISLDHYSTSAMILTGSSIDDNVNDGVRGGFGGWELTMVNSSVSRNGGPAFGEWSRNPQVATLTGSHLDDNGHGGGCTTCGVVAMSLTLVDSTLSGNRTMGIFTEDLDMVRSQVNSVSSVSGSGTTSPVRVFGSASLSDSVIDGGGIGSVGLVVGPVVRRRCSETRAVRTERTAMPTTTLVSAMASTRDASRDTVASAPIGTSPLGWLDGHGPA